MTEAIWLALDVDDVPMGHAMRVMSDLSLHDQAAMQRCVISLNHYHQHIQMHCELIWHLKHMACLLIMLCACSMNAPVLVETNGETDPLEVCLSMQLSPMMYLSKVCRLEHTLCMTAGLHVLCRLLPWSLESRRYLLLSADICPMAGSAYTVMLDAEI